MTPDHDPRPALEALRTHLSGLQTWGLRRMAVRSDHPERPLAPVATARRAADSESPMASRPSAHREASAGTPAAPIDARSAAPSRPEPGSRRLDSVIADLDACRSEVAACTACRLHEGRSRTVFGVGDPVARLMLIGEGPGADEDRLGEPFVGRAGQLLDKIIGALGLQRREVYIANVVKCRPPGNRTPTIEEVETCTPFLARQIAAIQPEMIVALGRPASNYLLGTDQPLGRLRGRMHAYKGIPVVVTYHPAYLLRTPEAKRDTWLDLQSVIEALGLQPPVPFQRG
ncbi:MAG: uracil-DNA glycosylase [Planctomycetes bacterium]|nr:uracil-DNA glycosylase [Planctomycetota bacterium]